MRRQLALVLVTTAIVVTRSASAQSQSQEIYSFQSPSGNIDCLGFEFDKEVAVSCMVNLHSWSNPPKKPKDCDLDWAENEIGLTSTKQGKRVTNVTRKGTCRGDTGPNCFDLCQTLDYGKSKTLGRIKCTSFKEGVTCESTAGKRHGFTVSKAAYRVF